MKKWVQSLFEKSRFIFLFLKALHWIFIVVIACQDRLFYIKSRLDRQSNLDFYHFFLGTQALFILLPIIKRVN